MKIRNLRYYIRESFLSIIRNQLMSVASIITVSCCIFVLTFSYIFVVNVDHILSGVEDGLIISVFILDEVPDARLNEIEARILSIDHVVYVEFISSEGAMANFFDNPGLFNELNRDDVRILPRSFDVSVDNIIYQDQVRRILERYVGTDFEQVRNAPEAVDALISINNAIRMASIFAIIFLSSVSVIIIINTIKLTVSSRQNEINIMQYVGATAWFIRWPFIIEGMIIGFLGALFPVIIGFISYGEIIRRLDLAFPAIIDWFDFLSTQEVFVILIPFALSLGVLIGSVGSVTSVRRHLHV